MKSGRTNGQAGGAAWPLRKYNGSHRKSTEKSTTAVAQQLRIVTLLRARPHNSYELRRAGCYQAPTRVFELRRRGFEIETSRVVVVDADAFTHRGVALYTLLAEPEGGAS